MILKARYFTATVEYKVITFHTPRHIVPTLALYHSINEVLTDSVHSDSVHSGQRRTGDPQSIATGNEP